MRKRLVRHRLLVTFFILAAAAACLVIPIRHEYLTQVDKQTGTVHQTTQVFYGIPFAWMTLSKQVDNQTGHTLQSFSKRDNHKLVYNILIYVAVLVVVAIPVSLDKWLQS